MNKLNSLVDLFSLEANETVIVSKQQNSIDKPIAIGENCVNYMPFSVAHLADDADHDKFMSVNRDELRAQFDYKDRPLNSVYDYSPKTLTKLYKAINAARNYN